MSEGVNVLRGIGLGAMTGEKFTGRKLAGKKKFASCSVNKEERFGGPF